MAVEFVDDVEVSDQLARAVERSVGVGTDSRGCQLALEKTDLQVILHVGGVDCLVKTASGGDGVD